MKILIGMSGGLDSTYAAYKLKAMGHEVEGAVIKMHPHTEICEAKESADALGIRLHVIDAEEEFENSVVKNFLSEYKEGRTPNPCIVCNSEVKFKLLYDTAKEMGFDKIASGHYAEIVKIGDGADVRYAIKRSLDQRKDQSYMLYRLSQQILSNLIFPLSDENKAQIREKAREIGLVAADRGESQEICFVPDNDYAAFIEKRTGPSKPGLFINKEGKTLGTHRGIIHYTIGQRKGLGISVGERAFVTDIDVKNNTVTLDTGDSFSNKIKVGNMVFSGMKEPRILEKLSLYMKHRYHAGISECTLTYLGNGTAEVEIKEAVRAVTPGQSAVFYKDETVVMGGFILK